MGDIETGCDADEFWTIGDVPSLGQSQFVPESGQAYHLLCSADVFSLLGEILL